MHATCRHMCSISARQDEEREMCAVCLHLLLQNSSKYLRHFPRLYYLGIDIEHISSYHFTALSICLGVGRLGVGRLGVARHFLALLGTSDVRKSQGSHNQKLAHIYHHYSRIQAFPGM